MLLFYAIVNKPFVNINLMYDLFVAGGLHGHLSVLIMGLFEKVLRFGGVCKGSSAHANRDVNTLECK